VLLGDFGFVGEDAYIYLIDEIAEVEENELDKFCEDSLDIYEGYLIPEKFNGKILM
jgi:hypothetical protein